MVKKENQTFKDYRLAIIFGGGGLLIALILLGAVGTPLYQNLRKTSVELKAKKAQQAQLETKLENLKSLKNKEADLTTQSEKVLSALPQDKDVSRLFVQFENIAKQNGVTILSVSEDNQAATTAPAGGLAPVTYIITGSLDKYSSLKTALAKIETALRVLSVDRVEVSGTNGNYSITFNVKTYVRGANK